MNEDLIKMLRDKFQEDMRISVNKIEEEFIKYEKHNFISLNSMNTIDQALEEFSRTKDKATHFESIIKHLKNNKNDEN